MRCPERAARMRSTFRQHFDEKLRASVRDKMMLGVCRSAVHEDGDLDDYDGFGEYALRSKKLKSNVTVVPSDLDEKGWNALYTHVVWYNR